MKFDGLDAAKLLIHHFKALCKELRCGFHCVDAHALVDCVDTFLIIERHKEGRKAVDVVAHVAVIAAVAVCDKHVRRCNHRREYLLDCDVEVVPGLDVDGRNGGSFRTLAVPFHLDVFAEKFLGVTPPSVSQFWTRWN